MEQLRKPDTQSASGKLDKTGTRVQVFENGRQSRTIDAFNERIRTRMNDDMRHAQDVLSNIGDWTEQIRQLLNDGGMAQYHAGDMAARYNSALVTLKRMNEDLQIYMATPEYKGQQGSLSAMQKTVANLELKLMAQREVVENLSSFKVFG
jgi:hypothetical protein